MSNAPIDREELKKYLHKEHIEPAGHFVNSPLWTDFKRALLSRAPEDPVPTDEPHIAAAKAFENKAWRRCIQEFEMLPFDIIQTPEPAIPASLLNEKD